MLNFIIWHSRCKISKFACILPLFLVDEETDAVDQNGGHGSDPTHGNPGGCDIHQRRPILSCNILRIQLVKGADCEGGQRNADKADNLRIFTVHSQNHCANRGHDGQDTQYKEHTITPPLKMRVCWCLILI